MASTTSLLVITVTMPAPTSRATKRPATVRHTPGFDTVTDFTCSGARDQSEHQPRRRHATRVGDESQARAADHIDVQDGNRRNDQRCDDISHDSHRHTSVRTEPEPDHQSDHCSGCPSLTRAERHVWRGRMIPREVGQGDFLSLIPEANRRKGEQDCLTSGNPCGTRRSNNIYSSHYCREIGANLLNAKRESRHHPEYRGDFRVL